MKLDTGLVKTLLIVGCAYVGYTYYKKHKHNKKVQNSSSVERDHLGMPIVGYGEPQGESPKPQVDTETRIRGSILGADENGNCPKGQEVISAGGIVGGIILMCGKKPKVNLPEADVDSFVACKPAIGIKAYRPTFKYSKRDGRYFSTSKTQERGISEREISRKDYNLAYKRHLDCVRENKSKIDAFLGNFKRK